MKKKILCLALCALMIIASLAGCGEKSRDELMNKIGEETSQGAVTLTMHILAEDAVSAEQEKLVEDAVNDIMHSYKIKLDLKYFTIDDYYETLEANLARMKTYYGNKENLNKETEIPAYTDENGLPVTYYPPNEDFQVDLFYFSGYDKYVEYSKEGYLADFTARLVDSASLLKGSISSILYESVKTVNGKYDMMPVNAAVGEYTYMLVNKNILASTQFTAEEIASPMSDNCAELLAMVDNYYPDYTPLYSSVGVLAFDDVKFFGVDEKGFDNEGFSILAGTYNSNWKYGAENAYPTMGGINATVDNGSFTVKKQIERLKGYEFNGYYADASENSPFAVGYVKGGTEIVDEYGDDYEIIVLEEPKLTTEALYENVMAISAQAKDVSKSARVLAELYTNEEFINLIVNGVEGENYIWTTSDELDKNDNPYRVIQEQVRSDEYIYDIDPCKYGNLAAIYPTVDEDPARSERILEQNADAKADLLLGYTLYNSGVKLDSMALVAEYSAEAYSKILEAANEEELNEAFTYIDVALESDAVKAVMAESESAFAYYTKWLTEKKIIAPAEAK